MIVFCDGEGVEGSKVSQICGIVCKPETSPGLGEAAGDVVV